MLLQTRFATEAYALFSLSLKEKKNKAVCEKNVLESLSVSG